MPPRSKSASGYVSLAPRISVVDLQRPLPERRPLFYGAVLFGRFLRVPATHQDYVYIHSPRSYWSAKMFKCCGDVRWWIFISMTYTYSQTGGKYGVHVSLRQVLILFDYRGGRRYVTAVKVIRLWSVPISFSYCKHPTGSFFFTSPLQARSLKTVEISVQHGSEILRRVKAASLRIFKTCYGY